MFKKKPIIGILSILSEKKDYPYDTVYKVVNAYTKKIENIDCIPIGLLNITKNIEILDLCDAFIMPGGNRVSTDHYYIIRHCIDKNKPLLGVCLGMQAMVFYDYLWNQVEDKNIENMYQKITELHKEGKTILKEIESNIHGKELFANEEFFTEENIRKTTHTIHIKRGSKLYEIYQTEKKDVISLHQYGVKNTTNLFEETAYAEDNIVEAIEYKEKSHFIVGVEYHPEIEDDALFKAFKKEIDKRQVL